MILNNYKCKHESKKKSYAESVISINVRGIEKAILHFRRKQGSREDTGRASAMDIWALGAMELHLVCV